VTTIDHLGIAVKSIAEARRLYVSLGLGVVHEEVVEQEGVRAAMIPVGESRIELLEATSADTPVGRFLTKHGEGLHHVAFHVEDISGAFEQIKRDGFEVLSEDIQIGVDGHLYFFVHPHSASGVLIEICQDSIADV
jgi:methylmalonyl-CoA epimerase